MNSNNLIYDSTTRENLFYIPTTDVDILFEGHKPIWKTRINIDVIIAYHENHDFFEVITHHPLKGIEAPRLYIDIQTLTMRIINDELRKYLEDKRIGLSHEHSVALPKFTREVQLDSMVVFIFNRIDIVEDPDEFRITLSHMALDSSQDENTFDFVVEKPEDLIPLETNFRGRVRAVSEIEDLLHDIDEQAGKLKEATKLAENVALSDEGHKVLIDDQIRKRTESERHALVRARWYKAYNFIRFRIMKNKLKVRCNLLFPEMIKENIVKAPIETTKNTHFIRKKYNNFFKYQNSPSKQSKSPTGNDMKLPPISPTNKSPARSPSNISNSTTVSPHSTTHSPRSVMHSPVTLALSSASLPISPHAPEKQSTGSRSNFPSPRLTIQSPRIHMPDGNRSPAHHHRVLNNGPAVEDLASHLPTNLLSEIKI